MSRYALSPGENDASALPAFMRPSSPTSWMHVIPSAPTHTPDLQSVANELQSVLSMHCMQNCLSTVDCNCPASCDVSAPTTNDLMGPKLAMVQRKSPGCDSSVSMLPSRLLTAALLNVSCVRS